MVKVIKQGTERLTCYTCKSELEYSHSDVRHSIFNMDYLGDFDTIPSIQCPVCNTVCQIKIGPHGY